MARTVSFYAKEQEQVDWVINHIDQSNLRMIGFRLSIKNLENWEAREVLKFIRKEELHCTIETTGLCAF